MHTYVKKTGHNFFEHINKKWCTFLVQKRDILLFRNNILAHIFGKKIEYMLLKEMVHICILFPKNKKCTIFGTNLYEKKTLATSDFDIFLGRYFPPYFSNILTILFTFKNRVDKIYPMAGQK
jgi:hypothetical protein